MTQVKAKKLVGVERSDARQRMRRDYESGMTIVAIAGKWGRSYGNTHTLLTEAGTEMRRRGGSFR